MNSRRWGKKTSRARLLCWAAPGQSYVELAFALPVLAIFWWWRPTLDDSSIPTSK